MAGFALHRRKAGICLVVSEYFFVDGRGVVGTRLGSAVYSTAGSSGTASQRVTPTRLHLACSTGGGFCGEE